MQYTAINYTIVSKLLQYYLPLRFAFSIERCSVSFPLTLALCLFIKIYGMICNIFLSASIILVKARYARTVAAEKIKAWSVCL